MFVPFAGGRRLSAAIAVASACAVTTLLVHNGDPAPLSAEAGLAAGRPFTPLDRDGHVAVGSQIPATAASTASPSTFTRADVAEMTDEILAPWPALQNANGTFPDYYRGNNARGRSRGYDEAMMGAVLLRRGSVAHNQAMIDAGLAGLAREVDPAHYVTPSVFEAYAVAMAYRDLHSSRGLAAAPELERRMSQWLARYRTVYMSPERPFSNQRTIEAAAYRLMLATGVRSRVSGAVLASRQRALADLTDYEQALHAAAAFYTRSGAMILSDPPRNPLAYVSLTAAFLARYIATSGRSASPRLRAEFLRLSRGLSAATAPDGDIAYVGRSQQESWALSFGAYAALQASAWDPDTTRSSQFRGLAARYLQRLKTVHMPDGHLSITPVLAWQKPAARAAATSGAQPVVHGASLGNLVAGVDGYAGAVVYNAMTALGLLWTDEALTGRITSTSSTPFTGTLSTGQSQLVILRRGDVWAAVKPRHAWKTDKVDLRADAGLVRLKVAREGVWSDLLAAAPDTHGDLPDSLSPRPITGDPRPTLAGTIASVAPTRVTIRMRYDGGLHAVLTVRLTASGAIVELTGRPGTVYRLGVMRYRTMQRASGRTWLRTERALHHFAPAPRAIRAGSDMTSADAMLRRYDIEIAIGAQGHLRWTITP